MTPDHARAIPDDLLYRDIRGGCRGLIEWLDAHGCQLTLLELEEERIRRGLGGSTTPQPHPRSRTGSRRGNPEERNHP